MSKKESKRSQKLVLSIDKVEQALQDANEACSQQIAYLLAESRSGILDKDKTTQLTMLVKILLDIRSSENKELQQELQKLSALSPSEIKEYLKKYI